MKKLLMAASMLAVCGSAAFAQPVPQWEQGKYPYARKHHGVCIEKARRLHGYEARAASDGKISRHERATIADLQRDLDRTCGKYRWNG